MPEEHTAEKDAGLIADDLFAGAGGWDLGAAALGIEARGIEIMPEARATREAAGLITIHDDVWTFWPDGRAAGEIASPPCPTFSTAGKGTGRRALDSVLCAIDDGAYRDLEQLREYPVSDDDDRTRLVLTPLHFATQHEYEWLAWEQVPTVLPIWEACAAVLRADGWNVWTGIVYAEQYGVAQTRKRAKLLASRRHRVERPAPTHSRYYSHDPGRLDLGVRKWVSMAEAFGCAEDFRVISNYGTGGDPRARGVRTGDQPAATVTSKVDRNRIEWRFAGAGQTSEQTSGQIPRDLDQPAHTITGKATAAWVLRGSNAAHTAIRSTDRPAPTMLFGHCSNDVRWYPAGITKRGVAETAAGRNPDSVRVTVSEAGILQSFSADYPWQGTQSKQYLQAGNAVPPLMAMHSLAVASGVAIETEEAVA